MAFSSLYQQTRFDHLLPAVLGLPLFKNLKYIHIVQEDHLRWLQLMHLKITRPTRHELHLLLYPAALAPPPYQKFKNIGWNPTVQEDHRIMHPTKFLALIPRSLIVANPSKFILIGCGIDACVLHVVFYTNVSPMM